MALFPFLTYWGCLASSEFYGMMLLLKESNRNKAKSQEKIGCKRVLIEVQESKVLITVKVSVPMDEIDTIHTINTLSPKMNGKI